MKQANLMGNISFCATAILCLLVSACGSSGSINGAGTNNVVTGKTGTLSAITYIPYNSSTTITWSSLTGAECTLTGNGTAGASGTSGLNGVFTTPLLQASSEYTLKCGDGSQSLAITVASSAEASSITAFAAGATGVTTVITLNSLTNGSQITISGTNSYNGTYTVSNQTSTSFEIAKSFVNGTENETGYWQLAGGMVFNCQSVATGNADALQSIDLTAYTASRFRGVAPLAVEFDASGTISNGSVITRPFHDIKYRWNFGDTSGSPVIGKTWTTGAQSGSATCNSAPYNGCRNNATGPLAAHVFETPGIYTVSLTATDGVNKVTNSCAQIVVQDPTILTTACVANGTTPSAGDADGCPATATLFYNSSSFNTALATAMTAGARRILFRKGDVFTSSAPYTVNVAGPGTIGAYGAANANNPLINVSGGVTSVLSMGNTDWRVLDLTMDGAATTNTNAISYSTSNPPSRLTLLRLTVTHLYYAVLMNYADQLAVVDSSFTQASASNGGSRYGVWCGYCSNVMLLGNSMYLNTSDSHNIRLQEATRFVIADSTQQGSVRIEPLTIRGNTQYGVLTNNKLIDNIVTVQPQNTGQNEQQHDIIFDGNWFVAGSNSGPALNLKCTDTTVRNNIFDLSGSSGYTAVEIGYNNTAGAPMTDKIDLYNNTIYNGAANNGNLNPTQAITFWSGTDSTCHANVMNNLVYSPNTINLAPVVIYKQGGNCVVTGAAGTYGNSSDSQAWATSPGFARATPQVPTDFVISAGSYANNSGNSLHIFSDFFGSDRLSSDMGAVTVP